MAGAYEVYRSYNADIKQIDEQEHIKLTGHSNKNILAMARELSDMKKTCMDPSCACAGRK